MPAAGSLTPGGAPTSLRPMSRLPFELMLAFRYLRPRRTFFSVITLICVAGVMLGVAVLIIVISVMTGFDRELTSKILGFNAHVRIVKPWLKPMEDYAVVAATVAQNPHVKAVAPFVWGRVLLLTQPQEGEPLVDAPWVRGIDPKLEPAISALPSSIVAGELDVSGNGLVLGRDLALNLGLNVGDPVEIVSPRVAHAIRQAQRENRDIQIDSEEYVVKGIFNVGYYQFDSEVVVTSLGNAQDLYDLGDAAHGLVVVLDDPNLAGAVRWNLHARLGPDYRITTWQDENSGILTALAVEKNVMLYILFFIIVVAAFGITSALITFVVQKTREIGLLKAMGATNAQVTGIFLSQSFIVGALGVAAGFGLGMLALEYRNQFLHFMNRATGFELFPAAIYGFTELPALIVPRDIVIICGGSLLIAVAAGWLPAWNAGRLRPVEALRYE